MISSNGRVQFITHHNAACSYIDSARIALDGGCRWVQLRMKCADDALLEHTALVVQQLCRECGATFIIDDNVWLAKRIGADGVHLGKSDMPIAMAREILGEGYIIGATVNSFEDILLTLKESAPDYFGCGPFRFTSTKEHLAPILGLGGYRTIVAKMREHNINTPMVAIGGISKEDIPDIMACGVHGIALSSSVINASNPQSEMSQIVDIVSKISESHNL